MEKKRKKKNTRVWQGCFLSLIKEKPVRDIFCSKAFPDEEANNTFFSLKAGKLWT